jgi:hypothetical protein
MPADEDLHGHAAETAAQADALLLAAHGPTLLAGPEEPVDRKPVSRLELRSEAVAMRYGTTG